jgi:hypothetical protein
VGLLPYPICLTLPMVGISNGQVARLNALNPGVPAPLATGALCSVQLSFVDANGVTLKTKQVLVAPGKSEPLDLDHDTEAAILAAASSCGQWCESRRRGRLQVSVPSYRAWRFSMRTPARQ